MIVLTGIILLGTLTLSSIWLLVTYSKINKEDRPEVLFPCSMNKLNNIYGVRTIRGVRWPFFIITSYIYLSPFFNIFISVFFIDFDESIVQYNFYLTNVGYIWLFAYITFYVCFLLIYKIASKYDYQSALAKIKIYSEGKLLLNMNLLRVLTILQIFLILVQASILVLGYEIIDIIVKKVP